MLNVLLTAENAVSHIPSIVTMVFAIIIMVCMVLIISRRLNSMKGREAVVLFLKDIEAAAVDEAITYLKSKDVLELIKNTDILATAEQEMIAGIYSRVRDVCLNKFNEVFGESKLYDLMFNILEYESIERFCRQICEIETVNSLINSLLEKAAVREYAEIEALEKEYTEINDKIENGDYSDGEEVPEIDPDKAFGEDLWDIKPPTEDDEIDFDEGTEIIGETIEEVDVLADTLAQYDKADIMHAKNTR